MIEWDMITKLFDCFPGSYINSALEFVVRPDTLQYFRLEDCDDELDIKCKILEYLSRGAFKTCPYNSSIENERLHDLIFNGLNKYLGTNFTIKQIETIYVYLGNRIDHKKTIEFIKSGYDFNIFKN